MLNLKMKLQSLVKKARIAVIKWKLASVDNRQREVVYNTLLASAMRISAQDQYAERSSQNAARKRHLLEQLEQLTAPAPLWMGFDLSSPVDTQPAVDDLDVLLSVPQETIRATEAELRLAAGQATAGQTDHSDTSLDWPLPCDIKIGAGTIRRGVPLRTVVMRMNVLHAMAIQAYPTAANMAVDPASATAS